MRGRTGGLALAAITSITLVATACGGGGSEPEPGSSQAGGQAGGEVTVAGLYAGEPAVPGNTSEACGGDIVDAMTSKLVRYNTENAAPENDIAESIETSDNQALHRQAEAVQVPGRHRRQGQELRRCLELHRLWPQRPGWQLLLCAVRRVSPTSQCPDADCKGKPKAKTMSGLKVVDDYDLYHPDHRAGVEPAGAPRLRRLRSAAGLILRRPEGASRRSRSAQGRSRWTRSATPSIVISKFADYSGATKPNVDKLTFRIYQDPSAAYADAVAGSLDYIDESNIPQDQFIGDAYKSDFPDRITQREAGRISWITFSPNDPQLKDNPDLRKAISRAIDRDLITKQI